MVISVCLFCLVSRIYVFGCRESLEMSRLHRTNWCESLTGRELDCPVLAKGSKQAFCKQIAVRGFAFGLQAGDFL